MKDSSWRLMFIVIVSAICVGAAVKYFLIFDSAQLKQIDQFRRTQCVLKIWGSLLDAYAANHDTWPVLSDSYPPIELSAPDSVARLHYHCGLESWPDRDSWGNAWRVITEGDGSIRIVSSGPNMVFELDGKGDDLMVRTYAKRIFPEATKENGMD